MNMIPLEKQVMSFELAKRLKELGVKQESLFYWMYRRDQHVEAKAWFVYSADHIKEGKVWDAKKSEFARIEPLDNQWC